MLFEDNIIFNGDDCLTVGSPAKEIYFRNSYCNGGHGLSIGSLGKGGAVANVRNVLYVIHTPGKSVSLISLRRFENVTMVRPWLCWYFRTEGLSGVAGKRPLRSKVQELDWG